MRDRQSKIILLLLFTMMPAFISAQVSRNTAYFLEWGEHQFSPAQRQSVEDSVSAKLARVDAVLVTEIRSKFAGRAQRTEHAVSEDYDSYLYLKLGGSMQLLQASWEIYDNVFNKIVRENNLEGAVDSDFTNLLGGFWVPVVKELRNSLFSFSSKVTLTFEGEPGTLLYGLGEEVITVGEDGKVQAELDAYANYRVRARLAGYYPVEKEILVEEGNTLIRLEQKKKFNVNFDIGLYDVTYLKLGIAYYFIPDTAFFQLSTTIYQAQLMVNNGQEEFYQTDGLLPQLNTLSFRIGGAVDLQHAKVRLPMGVEFFLRMTSLTEDKLDPASSFGMEFPVGLEFFPHRNVALYLEYSPLLYFLKDPVIFSEYLNYSWKKPYYVINETVAADFLHLNLGIRVQI